MPQSSIFGNNLSHPFAQQPDLVQGFGGQLEHNNMRLKRRKEHIVDEAGNFEIGQILLGPSEQKRGRFALSAAIDTDVPIESDMCAVPESTPNIPSAPICNSMVTHMTTSFLTDCGSAPEINHNADADADAAEYCCDMETDEPVVENSSEVPNPGYATAELFSNDRPADVQEPFTRNSCLYMYRCKPQYYVFH